MPIPQKNMCWHCLKCGWKDSYWQNSDIIIRKTECPVCGSKEIKLMETKNILNNIFSGIFK